MSSGGRAGLGLAAALWIGAALWLSLGAPRSEAARIAPDPDRVRVSSAVGWTWQEQPEGGLAAVRVGQELTPPVVLVTEPGSSIAVEVQRGRLEVGPGTRLLIGTGLHRLQLDAGAVQARFGSSARLHVPSLEVNVRGRHFAATADGAVVAVGETLSVTGRDGRTFTLEPGEMAGGSALERASVPTRLEVEVSPPERRGRSYLVTGRTAPFAAVRALSDGETVTTVAGREGNFSLLLPSRSGLGVEAWDGLGRVARPGQPSVGTEAVDSKGGGPAARPPAPSPDSTPKDAPGAGSIGPGPASAEPAAPPPRRRSPSRTGSRQPEPPEQIRLDRVGTGFPQGGPGALGKEEERLPEP